MISVIHIKKCINFKQWGIILFTILTLIIHIFLSVLITTFIFCFLFFIHSFTLILKISIIFIDGWHRLAILPWGGSFGKILSQGFDDSSPPHPQPNDDSGSSIHQDPDGGLSLLSCTSLRTNYPQGNKRSNRIAENKTNDTWRLCQNAHINTVQPFIQNC